ncbi:MAG TPA: adenylate/guanylate cyclase domain-containing protein [Planctomycetota bacterium]|nr:adenylate/guanylate cyclase domain-containing protein [Planctomycetota bacterium]
MSAKFELVVHKEADSRGGKRPVPTRISLTGHDSPARAVMLGREEKCTLVFSADSRISRQHCMVWMDHDKVFVKDLRSLNKTFLNGVQLVPDKEYQLLPGQMLTMGSTSGTSRVALEAAEAPLTVIPTLAGFGFEDEEPGCKLDAKINISDFTPEDKSLLQGRLKWLYETSHAMSNAHNLGDIVEICLDQVMAAFREACHVMLVLYSRDGQLPTAIKRNARQVSSLPEGLACARFRSNSAWDTRELKLSRTILRRVKDEKVAFWINAKELKTLTTFKSAIGSDTFNKINAVMASPLISGDKNLGLIQLFSYKVFTDEDVNILRLLTAQTSLVIRNIELAFMAAEETTRRENLQRFFAPSIAARLLNGDLKAELGGKSKEGTIFYSDICGFTSMASDMPPEDAVSLLNRYFSVMQQLIFRRGGSVDKCAGDQIMAVWGVLDEQPDYTAHAVTAGLEMQIALFEFNRDEPARARFTLPPGGLAHGIGLNTGKVCAGNIGSMQKIEFTVIGDAVNVANRIESAAGRGQVFVSETTWNDIAPRALGFRLPPVALKNVRHCPPLIAVRGIVPPGQSIEKFSAAEMLLNMPCEIKIAGDPPSQVEALATGFAPQPAGNAIFILQTNRALPADAACEIVWKIPESKRFTPLNGKVLRAEAPNPAPEETAVPLASDARCGLIHDEARLAPGAALVEVSMLPAEWQELKPGTLLDSDYKSEHDIIR